jgi:RES domain-containing protein
MPPAPRQLWRISDFPNLDGGGGALYSARWHTAGRPIVYLAESAPGAMLEVLVHLEVEDNDLPRSYNLLRVTAPDDIQIESLAVPDNDSWKRSEALTQAIGDEWLRSLRTPLAEVPSAIMPGTRNYLFNPDHPHASQVRVAEIIRAEFDLRLLRKSRR